MRVSVSAMGWGVLLCVALIFGCNWWFLLRVTVGTAQDVVSPDGNYRCVVETHTRGGGNPKEFIVVFQKKTSSDRGWSEIRRVETPSTDSVVHGAWKIDFEPGPAGVRLVVRGDIGVGRPPTTILFDEVLPR